MDLLIACLVASVLVTVAVLLVMRSVVRKGRRDGQVYRVDAGSTPAETDVPRVRTR